MIKWRYYRKANLWRAFWVEERHLEYFYGGGNALPCVAIIFPAKEPRRPGGRPVVVGYQYKYVHNTSGFDVYFWARWECGSLRECRKALVDHIERTVRRYRCGCGAEVPACARSSVLHDFPDVTGDDLTGISWAGHMCDTHWPGRKVDRHSCTVLPAYEKAPPIVGEAPSVNPNDGRDPIVRDTVPQPDPIGNPPRAAGGGFRPSPGARSQDDDARPVGYRDSDKAFVELYNTLFDRPAEASRANGASYLRPYECADLRERVGNILALLREINEAEADNV